jgi:hypothetical protein
VKLRQYVDDVMEGFMGDGDLAERHTKFKDPNEMSLLKEKTY